MRPDELEAGWRASLQDRRACRCSVCRQPADVRAWIDGKCRETRANRAQGGAGSVGLGTLARYLVGLGLAASRPTLEKHVERCLDAACGAYDDAP